MAADSRERQGRCARRIWIFTLTMSCVPAYSETGPIEEVVVTAQKREQAIMDVPVSVQALQGADLERLGIRDVQDVLALVPGASVPAVIGPGTQTYQLRGVSASEVAGDATVATYLDEFAFNIPGSPVSIPAEIFDLQRVEVLRGPQGTLYGKGSIGGVIKLVTNDPVLNEFSSRAQGSFADISSGEQSYSGDVMVNVPVLEDKVAVRAVVGAAHTGGWFDAPALGEKNVNDSESKSGRLKVLVQPSQRLRIEGSVWRQDIDKSFYERIDHVNPPRTNDTGPGETPADWTLTSMEIGYDWDGVTLTSATGALDWDSRLIAFGEIPTFGAFAIENFSEFESFNQEIRLSSNGSRMVDWVVGGFYQDSESQSDSDFNISSPPLTIQGASSTESESWAVFGEVSVNLMDGRLVPLVGLRYFEEDRSLLDEQTTLLGGAVVSSEAESTEGSFDDVSPRFNLSFFPVESLMVFSNVAKGFRSGAILNEGSVIGLGALGIQTAQQLEEDSLWSYEAGAKWEALEGRLAVDVVGYWIDWKDAQIEVSPGGISAVLNLGDVEGKGVDLSVRYRMPGLGLTAEVAANVNDTELTSVDPAITSSVPHVRSGMQLPGTPKNTVSVIVSYFRPVPDWNLQVLADVRYQHRDDQQGLVTGLRSGNLDIFSARVGFARDSFTAMVYGENLGNDDGPIAVPSDRYTVQPPRSVGVRFSVDL